ncbi:glutamyl-Q tRNA(Asp) synthetase [Marinospirillum celere]|uniref:Glutamyl-Q tRNA(Asp) synthetase n=1 Tax=Marinospirillum celere TaxID=1122252 RepID=A0A1I1ILR8_9GAMM|nr:tRNA glutamyl-Q(34) synthetase GluQRS [Marinospirillum celere]SFC34170.1 glutamyl-Q tRNA(Asp) synthetase [Marinospirillum celere]
MQYVGRFAPTPSGSLHLGSLVTALASWLDARSQQGKWLLRIEDLDPPREEPGAADQILYSLEQLGLFWDGPLVYQSQRSAAYQQALQLLQDKQLAYPCSCTRKELAGFSIYPGFCRQGPRYPNRPLAWRFAVDNNLKARWQDAIQGPQYWSLADAGDVVIRRKDQLWAYQLAVTLDDLEQGITHIVRGIDLLDSTPWQINLAQALQPEAPAFQYAHLPVIVNKQGQKLSKQNLAPALDTTQATQLLYRSLLVLQQRVDPAWLQEKPATLLEEAAKNWQLERVPKVTQLPEESLKTCISTD